MLTHMEQMVWTSAFTCAFEKFFRNNSEDDARRYAVEEATKALEAFRAFKVERSPRPFEAIQSEILVTEERFS